LVAHSKRAAVSAKTVQRASLVTIATLRIQVRRLETVIDNLSLGVCYFDAEERLVLSNRRYAEIYRLAPQDIHRGATATEIVELRAAAGTTTTATDAYLANARAIRSGAVPGTWINELTDGRAIQVCYRPAPDGGWVATHEDITELKATRTVANERLSLQTLIDWVPDYLWVKDAKSRFVVANKAVTSDSGRANTCDMIGLTDFDIHAPEAARKFRAIEEDLLRSGLPMFDREELIVNSSGAKKWILSTKVPLRNDKNEIFALVGIARDITELKVTRTVANERVSLQALIDYLPDNLWVKDVNSRFVICNEVTASRMGYEGPDDLIGKSDLELLSPDIAEKFFSDEQTIVRTGRPMIDAEERVFGASGEMTWIQTTKVPLRNDQNEIFGVAGISRDITARKLADAMREGLAQILEMIATSAPLEHVLGRLINLVDSQLIGICSVILLQDQKGSPLCGMAPSLAEAYAKAIDAIRTSANDGRDGAAVLRREAIITTEMAHDPLWKKYCDLTAAHGYPSCRSTSIVSHEGAIFGTFAIFSATEGTPSEAETKLTDVATRIASIALQRKRTEDRIQFMANHDALTGLPNRTLLKDRLSQALLSAQRHDHWVTVAFIDLDNFKVINDNLGHNAGDELLKIVANRMVDCLRATDTVVRLGGDEFVILLLDQPKDVEAISATIQKLASALAEPVNLDGHELTVTASMGIANYPENGADPDVLLANADAAMYRAKEGGRDDFRFYTPDLNNKVHEKFSLQAELRNAVARSEFVLLYQPQVDLRSQRIFAVEALIRWQHPTLGLVPPLKFIPIAEATGLIVPIGEWVLRESCRQNKAWQDAGLPCINVSVNVSARQFRDKDLFAKVTQALEDSGLEAKYLELELTESLIIQDGTQAVATMKQLQDLGVQLSIDDFGTGYSGLGALKTFPVARLKIDKSFIHGLQCNENDKAIVSALISLGQKLNLKVIAEGVESEEQVAFLREQKCDEMQGYNFSKPIPAEAIARMLAAKSI
jgi:diguanylate cyclase (GGDEF)-like protein/PAS domain S-box-containing protein